MKPDSYFSPLTVADVVVRKLNKSYFLPAFQRKFEWDEDRISALFDSLMRGYPIGTFLTWRTKPYWPAYRFVTEARDGGLDNPPEPTRGMRAVTFVLDGQQRFSSLLVGLHGSFQSHMKYASWTEADGFYARYLYINLLDTFDGQAAKPKVTAAEIRPLAKLLRTPGECDDGCDSTVVETCIHELRTLSIGENLSKCYNNLGWDEQSDSLLTPVMKQALLDSDQSREDPFGAVTGLRFYKEPPAAGAHGIWFRVGDVMKLRDKRQVESAGRKLVQNVTGLGQTARERCRANLMRLHDVVWTEKVIRCHDERSDTLDRVVDIFIRANERGKPLTRSDLLFSLVSAKWAADGEDGPDARQEFDEFVYRVNNKLPLRNNITRDFVLKTCLVLCGFEVEYRVGSFTRKRLAKIKREWPQIQDAILRTVQMVNSFGIRRDNLTSLNALIPVIYFLYLHPDIDPTSPTSRLVPKNTRAVRAWLLTALLSRAFSGSSDVAIRAAREALKDNKDEVFPAAAVNRELRSVGKDVAITDLDRFSYGRRETYLALSLLYPEEYWRLGKQDIDHIFARSRINEKALREAGIKEATRRALVDQRDRIGNLMFLPGDDNRKEKRAKPIKVWIKMRDPRKFMRDGLIPRGADLLELSRFDTFVRKRETKILTRLRTLVPIGRRKARR